MSQAQPMSKTSASLSALKTISVPNLVGTLDKIDLANQIRIKALQSEGNSLQTIADLVGKPDLKQRLMDACGLSPSEINRLRGKAYEAAILARHDLLTQDRADWWVCLQGAADTYVLSFVQKETKHAFEEKRINENERRRLRELTKTKRSKVKKTKSRYGRA